MALELTETFTFPAAGNRRSEFEEFGDGSATCTYRATSNEGITRSRSFVGADIVADYNANAAYLDQVKADFPEFTTGTQIARVLLCARALLRAKGDNAIGIVEV